MNLFLKKGQGKWGWLIGLVVAFSLLCVVPAFAADSYTIKVPALAGGTSSNSSYTLSAQTAQAGETITIELSTTRSGYAPAAVSFYDTQTWSPTTIPGYSITRSYDNPNLFSFKMPPQNVALQAVFKKKVSVMAQPYYTPPLGSATPASADGSMDAVAYQSAKPLSGGNSPLFLAIDDQIEGYLYQFSDGVDHGTIDVSGTYLTYTPNASAAGTTVTIAVKAYSGGGVSEELLFDVAVNAIPEPSKSDDISLQSLHYQLEGQDPVVIPVVADQYDYQVTLPKETVVGTAVTLIPVAADAKATIENLTAAEAERPSSTAGFTVQAEDPSVSKAYQVRFAITPPDIAPSITSGGTIYNDGDTVLIKKGEKKQLRIDHGAGAIGFGSLSYSSSNFDILPLGGFLSGTYPNTVALETLTPATYGTLTFTVHFYTETAASVTGLTPAKTVVLTILTEADYTKVDEALAKIPGNLWAYTAASVQGVTDAKNAVNRQLDYSRQAIVDGYATAIETAIARLTYRSADYSKVDAALAKIPGDLSGYTAESVAALEQAKNAVIRGKNIMEQATVDAYAAAIEAAMNNLTLKPEPPQYEIVEGAGQTVSTGQEASFRSSADLAKFKAVWVDDSEVAAQYYTLSEGSTVVTLHEEYLAMLSEGVHVLRIVSLDGAADTTFTLVSASSSEVSSEVSSTPSGELESSVESSAPVSGSEESMESVSEEPSQESEQDMSSKEVTSAVESTKTTSSAHPNTGDGNPLVGMLLLFTGTAAGCGLLLFGKRKRG